MTDQVTRLVIENKYLLVETMAEDIASTVLKNPKAMAVKVNIKKPQAISNTVSVGVEVLRKRA